MSEKARVHAQLNLANTSEYYDTSTHERVFALSPIYYEDDFLGAGKQAFPTSATQGVDWVKKLVQSEGSPSVAGIAAAAFGQVALALDATSEKQEATLYWADNKHIDITKGAVWEARVKVPTLPSAS